MSKINAIKLSLCALSVMNLGLAKVYLPTGITLQNLNPKQVEFAWDIHDTLCKKNKGESAGITISYLPTLFTNIGTIRSGIKKIKKEHEFASGEAYAEHFKKNKKQNIAQFIERISNAYRPTHGMEQLLKELSDRGYTHRLASNIGKRNLTILNTRLENIYKSKLFSYINGGTIIDYGLPPDPSILTIKGQLNYAKKPKPDHELYQLHTQSFNPHNTKIIVFIDDKVKNIEEANKHGWIGIHFTTVKKLKADLKMLGIIF